MEYNTYLSDDEVDTDNENNQIIELDQYGMPIEEIDEEEEEEIRRIINEKILSRNNLDENIFYNNNNEIQKKFVKDIKVQKKNTMKLEDFHNFIEKKIEERKPKKFVSKRFIERKNLESSLSTNNVVKIKQRHFNPKLVPYFFSEKYKKKRLNNEFKSHNFDNLDFPSL